MSFSDFFEPQTDIESPTYETDPNYSQIQELLRGYGEDILSGDLPEQFGLIGQLTTPEISAYRGNLLDDVKGSISESMARYGKVGSPEESALISKSVAQTGLEFDYNNMLRAMSGQQYLLGTGLNTLSNVASSYQAENAQKYNADLSSAQFGLQLEQIPSTFEELMVFAGQAASTYASASAGSSSGLSAGASA